MPRKNVIHYSLLYSIYVALCMICGHMLAAADNQIEQSFMNSFIYDNDIAHISYDGERVMATYQTQNKGVTATPTFDRAKGCLSVYYVLHHDHRMELGHHDPILYDKLIDIYMDHLPEGLSIMSG